MSIKNFAKKIILGSCAVVALICAGCGKQELVTFKQYSGTYDQKSYSVAASTWEKQEDQEGFKGVWKLVGTVKYDDKTGKTLYYGSADTQHFVAITVKHEKDVKVEQPSYKIDDRNLKPFDNGNENSFTLIKAISETTKDFVLTIKWNPNTEEKYKFIINKQNFTLEDKNQ